MFQPELLMYCQTEGGVYSYLYGAAKISAARDDDRIYVSIDRSLPREITDGLLEWLGMDLHRSVVRYRCDDNSRYFVQTAA